MDPTQFPWTENQQVTVKNPTKKDFNFLVHGKAYKVSAGKSATMPGFIAWNFVYNIAQETAVKEGQFENWNNEGFKEEYFKRFYRDIQELIQEVVEEPEPEVRTFDESEEDVPNPPAGQGVHYTPRAQQEQPEDDPADGHDEPEDKPATQSTAAPARRKKKIRR